MTGTVPRRARAGVVAFWLAVLMTVSGPAAPREAPRAGVVRVAGHGLADDDGPLTVLGATLFWAAWGYRHDRARLEANLAFLAGHGVDAIRVLGTVGPDNGWEDRTVDPAWPDYDEVITGLTDLAYDRYGLRVQWTIFGGVDLTPTREARQALVERFGRLLDPRAEKVLFVEIANEGYQTGFGGARGIDELRLLGRDLARSRRLLVALTAPQNDPGGRARTNRVDPSADVMTALTLYRPADVDSGAVDVATFHYDRDTRGPGGVWQPAREPWQAVSMRALPGIAGLLPPVLASNEPIGPESSGASETDPARLVANAAVSWISGHAVHVYHAGAGVRGGGRADLDVGRHANLFEVPDAAVQLDGLARTRDLLPADLANWRPLSVDDPDHPFVRSPMRDVYCARNGPELVCAAIAIDAQHSVLRAAGPMEVAVHDPVGRRTPGMVTLEAGGRLELDPARSVVILTGHLGLSAYN